MPELVDDTLSRSRFNLLLLGALAGLALLLTVIGIYGVISYSVLQRAHEIGIRMALGAAGRDVANMVLRQGMALAALGVLLGWLAALMLTRLMEKLLFNVSTTDWSIFLSVAMLLLGVSALASFFPARRAARLDPLEAFRQP